jgi:predicted N-acyltransferase
MGDIEQRPSPVSSNDREDSVRVRVAADISSVSAQEWDACAASGDSSEASDRADNPFIRHAFLRALEDSGSARHETGWLPQHLLMEDEKGRLTACMPCYLKSHSYGEYVFDHGWADAYLRAGGSYYPKLQCAVPFTPVTGRRLLVREGEDRTASAALLLQAGVMLADRLEVSSLHITFPTREEWDLAGSLGFLQRTDQQFHWLNVGYGSFEDFLGALTSRKRKVIRTERRRALADGIEIEWVTGNDLTEAHWDVFFAFYMDTGSRKWGSPYLTREFFSLIGETMADDVLLVLAKRGSRAIAGALNFIGREALYGRYWGALEEHHFLHFEVCYYQAIDFAIQHKLIRVEAGAQGEHKLARGYLPTETYSAHWVADPGLRRAVAEYLKRERAAVAREIALLAEDSPYRRKDRDSDSG